MSSFNYSDLLLEFFKQFFLNVSFSNCTYIYIYALILYINYHWMIMVSLHLLTESATKSINKQINKNKE